MLALASDFPRLWADPKTPNRERKRMARLLLEDVTLRRDEEILASISTVMESTNVWTILGP